MSLHQVALQDCPPQPWRNGGGLTRELLAWPSAQPWQLRVSVARIARDGAFSPFAGVQRWFCVLHGEGVRLDLPGGVAAIGPADEPLAFDGEAAPMCTLLEGPTEDLNLMAPRAAGQARMARAWPGSGLDIATRWRGLFTLQPCVLDIGDRAEGIADATLAWSDEAEAAPWQLHSGAGYWLSLSP